MEDQQVYINRANESRTRSLRVQCWIVILLSVATAIILTVVLLLSSKIDAERRIFMGTVLGVTQVGCVLMLVVARDNVEALQHSITMSAFVCGLCLGPSIWFIQ